mmetsp:Transcript_47247/g.85099  ORF Transcript_47247/g.85099 Transcript_47247/m.85099 type:complete len:652 (-) Transcript_47247:214-2169(-)
MLQVHQDIYELFRVYLSPEAPSDKVSWSKVCRVLQELDSSIYTESALLEIRSRLSVFPVADHAETPNDSVSLQSLIKWIYGYGDASVSAATGRPLLLRSKSKLNEDASNGHPGLVKRQKSLDVDRAVSSDDQVIFRVRTAAGEVVFSLMEQDLPGITIAQVRTEVSKTVGKIMDEIKLFLEVRELQDDEILTELSAEQQQPLEVLLITQILAQFDDAQPALEQLDILKGMLASSSHEYQMTAARQIRKMLSVEINPPIDEVIAVPNLIDRLLELCKQMETEQIQFEVFWVLTNICSGTAQHTAAVVDKGAPPIFVDVLKETGNREVKDQITWALGNIAGDSPGFRDQCLDAGAMVAVLDVVTDESSSLATLRNATWVLSNLCRGRPRISVEHFSPALEPLKTLIESQQDEDILCDAAWAIGYICDGPDNRVDAVVKAGMCRRLVELLQDPPSTRVLTPVLRAVGNVASGTAEHTQLLMDFSLFKACHQLLAHEKLSVRKETYWMISNILADGKDSVQKVIEDGLLELVVRACNEEQDFHVKSEGLWCISNSCDCMDPEQIQHLLQCGCMESVAFFLAPGASEKVQMKALDCVSNILETGEQIAKNDGKTNPFLSSIKETVGSRIQYLADSGDELTDDVEGKAMELMQQLEV